MGDSAHSGVRSWVGFEPISIPLDDQSQTSDGALVVFTGLVREQTDGRRVACLEYEAYRAMAERMMLEIGEQAVSRWGVSRVNLLHRVGCLDPGETCVLVSVSGTHRGEAFDACRFCIDSLKSTVPIWKKEKFVDGEATWVNHP